MARRTQRHEWLSLVGGTCLLLLGWAPRPSDAQASSYDGGIGLRFTDPGIAPIVTEAVALWRACQDYGHRFPRFADGSSGFRTVEVKVLSSSYDDRCGDFVGERIQLYRHAQFDPGRWRSCGSLPRNLAHELGHVLGLNESPSSGDSIMVSVNPWTNRSRRVSEEDCKQATARWEARLEREEPGRGAETSGRIERSSMQWTRARPATVQ